VLAALDQILSLLDRGESLSNAVKRTQPGLFSPVLQALSRRPWPSPRESILALRRLAESADGEEPKLEQPEWPPEAAEALAALVSSGTELPRLLCRQPRRLELLLDQELGRPWSHEELNRDLERRVALLDGDDEAAFAEQLATFRNDHYVRLAACEFLFPELEQVGRELATLADVCLDHSIDFVVGQLSRAHGPPQCESGAARLAAIAMGKHGAQELNFCSDIDLVFIYTSDDGAAGDLSLHEFFSRACRKVTRILSDPNREGFVFRVDLRLRPEGSRGPICNSLEGAERYYETWGGPYDRLAWLKARPCAGDLALGQEMVALLRPFVFPRSLRPEVLEQIGELYQQITRELASARGPGGWNVKLGEGGIRQVEFLVQALQLLHAGKRTALQEPATLRALDKLLFHGLITEREQRQLAEAYELWRRIEHRLQLRDGRQTHLLPDRRDVREWLAGHLGLAGDFEEEVKRRREQVRNIYATLESAAGGDALEAPDMGSTDLHRLLDENLPRDEAEMLLARAGFTQARRAAEQLALLSEKPWGPLGRRPAAATRRLALPLLEELARSPDPDAALRHTVDLVLRYGPYDGLWELLEGNRATLRLLVSLFGSSDHLARMFVDHPELMDRLLGAGGARRERSLEALRKELALRLSGDPDPEQLLNAVRRFRNEEVLRVGLHDIGGDLDLEQVWGQLSDLAQVCLERIYPMVLDEAVARYGTPLHEDGTPATMVVLGLGKLGSRELTYASDLDLIFIYSGEGETHHSVPPPAPPDSKGRRQVGNGEFFARLAQRLIGALSAALEEGRLYEVDTRLRPSGNQGTLVVSRQSFQTYHEQRAQLWERQALIKARRVAGDPTLGEQLERWIEHYVFEEGVDTETLRSEIDRHRRRMEKELAEENGDFYNLKFSPGGLLDIDFVVQYFQLCHAGKQPGLRSRSTLEALSSLSNGILDGHTVNVLTSGYRFLRRIESRLRIVRDRSAERLPRQPEGLEVMARRLGFRQQLDVTPGSRLLAEYRETTEAIRGIYDGIFGR
jgi:glutamate-ammonia-ligase adenylyltransferase